MTITITAFERSPDRGRGLARDMRVRWALEEVGQPYDVRLVSFAAMKQPAEFKNPEEDIVFYHCRYLGEDNSCTVHEDRPQFCRDYPDTPYVVMAPGCAFEPWAARCKTTMDEMRTEVARLKDLKDELDGLKKTLGDTTL